MKRIYRIAISLLGVAVASCTDNLSLFDQQTGAFGNQTVIELPNSPSGLNSQAPVERDLKDWADLVAAKRWAEAEQKLGILAGQLPTGSDLWVAVVCTQANTALAGDNLPAFRDAAVALERALGDRARMRPACPEILAIARHLSGTAPAPINTPERLTMTLDAISTPSSTNGRAK